ncbi:sensor histidine kinase [Paenibacillus filicis]|uniref:Sensor histidine kinase n=1 Tax=Paenibacillus filicis TaxID=669464 RepID=A0ABU9DFZ9_9BACL
MKPISLSIKHKLILYFFFSIVLPMTIISIIFYIKSSEILTKKMELSIMKNLNSVESILVQKLDSINDFSMLVTLNPELQSIISSPSRTLDMDQAVDEMLRLNKILDSYYLSDFSALTQTALYPKIYMINRPLYRSISIADKVFDISVAESQPWYSKLTNQLNIVGVENITVAGRSIHTLKIAKKLVALRSEELAPYTALLTTNIDTSYFIHLLKNYKITAGSSISIVDAAGQTLLASDEAVDQQQLLSAGFGKTNPKETFTIRSFEGKKTLVSTNYIEPLQWTIISLIPLDEVNIEQRRLNTYMYAGILICMLVAFFAASLFAGNISKPILALVKSMSFIDHGNFDIKLTYRKKDEFAILIEQYKKMMEKIKDLVERLYVSEVSKKEAELKAKDAELKALQAQINPHFLYNALDSINLYAMKYNVPNISSMVNSLSNFFRYGLSKGKSVITLRDEKKHVESYLAIQKMRFGHKLDYSIEIPNDILSCLTVKLILQPLVENSIIHGIQEKAGDGLIRISACKREELIQITISDNGAGADVEELHDLLKTAEATSRAFGIRNVNERIQHLFGARYGLRFFLNELGGLTAVVEIPQLRTMEGYHVENDIS